MPLKGDVQLMSAIKLIIFNHKSISHWNVVHIEQRFHWHGDSKTFIRKNWQIKKKTGFSSKERLLLNINFNRRNSDLTALILIYSKVYFDEI